MKPSHFGHMISHGQEAYPPPKSQTEQIGQNDSNPAKVLQDPDGIFYQRAALFHTHLISQCALQCPVDVTSCLVEVSATLQLTIILNIQVAFVKSASHVITLFLLRVHGSSLLKVCQIFRSFLDR